MRVLGGLVSPTDSEHACNTLHTLIARLSMAVDSYECCPIPEELPFIGRMFRDVYQYLTRMAEHFGIDIKAEYERKVWGQQDQGLPTWREEYVIREEHDIG